MRALRCTNQLPEEGTAGSGNLNLTVSTALMAPRAAPQDMAVRRGGRRGATPSKCCSTMPAWVIRVRDDELGGAFAENDFSVTCCAPQGYIPESSALLPYYPSQPHAPPSKWDQMLSSLSLWQTTMGSRCTR